MARKRDDRNGADDALADYADSVRDHADIVRADLADRAWARAEWQRLISCGVVAARRPWWQFWKRARP